jgi:Nucleotidyl transferase AbiEii toxin, Type IV TA system
MTPAFSPRLDILPAPQRTLWPELAETPADFTLYGGTAIALRLAHRQSVDFDFFSLEPFEPGALLNKVSYLRGAAPRQSSPNTLSVNVDRGGPVQLSYFGGLGIGQVAPAENVEGPGFKVASLIDLAGMKVATLPQRVALRDYLDIHALLTQARIPLPEMLAAAGIIYGAQFNALVSLKAIAYHNDFTLAQLPKPVRDDLLKAAKATDVGDLPKLDAVRNREPN